MFRPPLKPCSARRDSSPGEACTPAEIQDDRRERELDRISGTAKPKTMPVAFHTFVKYLAQAIQDDAAWLDDFSDDTIQIDADLHEVLMTYEQLRQQKAA